MNSELIVHIGDGKTGTSSIQKTLGDNSDALDQQGIRYLGYALERCETPRYEWQHPGAVNALLAADQLERRHMELFEVLRDEMALLAERGIPRAVWSNEALFLQNATAVHALKRLEETGVRVRLICYVRRHDQWAKSAYAQWGIKHKTYTGPVMPFSDWVKSRSLVFAPAVLVWETHFGKEFNLRNFDVIGDVSADFLAQIGAAGITPLRVYETPAPELLALWTYFNSQHDGEMLPNAFERMMRRNGVNIDNLVAIPPIEQFLPTDADLADLLRRSRDDIEEVNTVLESKGQPGFALGSRPQKPIESMPWNVDQILWQLILSLQQQVDVLQDRVLLLMKARQDGEAPQTPESTEQK